MPRWRRRCSAGACCHEQVPCGDFPLARRFAPSLGPRIMSAGHDETLQRWRLVLGEAAEGALPGLGGEAARMDAALDWLYSREKDLGERDIQGRQGGLGPSQLSVPDWIDQVHQL